MTTAPRYRPRPRLLDLFCGAGGCSAGYHRAGFDVVGVDLAPQHQFPFLELQQNDALLVLADVDYCRTFDVIHASPPCQAYTVARSIQGRADHPDLLGTVRDRLDLVGRPYVLENVPGAPMRDPVMLCGQSFGLGVFRHRLFETNWPLTAPPHTPHVGRIGDGRHFTVAGHPYGGSPRDGIDSLGTLPEWRRAMGIGWMSRDTLTQAIPPAYTEYIGAQLLHHLDRVAR